MIVIVLQTTDFEQVEGGSHFADSKQVKNLVIFLALKKPKNLVVILLTLN